VKSFINALLWLVFGVSIWFLGFQGFAAPSLPPLGALFLRILAAASGELLICRLARSDFFRLLPAIGASFFAVWGFFLLLTSPSWRHATFVGFLADYVSPAAMCWLVWWLYRRYHK